MPKFSKSKEEIQDIQVRTEKIEAQQEEKRLEREERKRQKDLKKQREFREKLVGPILLIITIVITLLIKMFSAK
ncbi:MAG: hypothetical protein OEX81_03125 [Candidatus Pacebacteria bacterium]|nr:hypothetical protein [Candidatus Paceibacterota bacterium]